ncbi:MAG TPA: M20/M25/M40 family metallo-hydrolase [Anaerolineaceae bacterium]
MIDKIIQSILDLACQIQQIPAPTLDESERAVFLYKLFSQKSIQNISQDSTGNVYGKIEGNQRKRPAVISAHLDTVHPRQISLNLTRSEDRITGPGIADNSLSLAILVYLPELLVASGIKPAGDIWLVANVCEEGLGNLRGMRAVVDRFTSLPEAYIVLEGAGLGEVTHRGLGVDRYRISVTTSGGHSWKDYGKPSAIHILARLITSLASLSLPVEPRTTLNVGVVHGGLSVNTVAPYAWCDLDLRSEDQAALHKLATQVQEIAAAYQQPEVIITCEPIGSRPAGGISENHPLVKKVKAALLISQINPILSIGSTDANIPLAMGFPSVCIGMTHGGKGHTTQEYIEIAPLSSGIRVLLDLLASLWENQ